MLGKLDYRRWNNERIKTIRTVSLVASASLLITVFGVVGSLVQARFVSPEQLGFFRKYSVISGYAVFLNLGLFTIFQREYPVLIGQGKEDQAHQVAAIVKSWCLLMSIAICGVLGLVTLVEALRGRWQEAAAWFIQVVAVWSALYVGYLSVTFRSSQEFEKLAKGQSLSAFGGLAAIPGFFVFPLATLVVRSVASPIIYSAYLHWARPLRVGWSLPHRELLDLVKRGIRLYAGNYLRYTFWLTVEIWLMYRVAGDVGVGLLVFSKMLVDGTAQLAMAINQVYVPRLGTRFGESASIRTSLQLGVIPTAVNLFTSALMMLGIWFVLLPIIGHTFPKYANAIPLIRILMLQMFIVSISLPIYMITVLEAYLTQFIAAVAGIGVLVGSVWLLQKLGLHMTAVAWGTLAGQVVFAGICIGWLFREARAK